MARFSTSKIQTGLRFESALGVIDLHFLDERRALIACGLTAGTLKEQGQAIWQLLSETMPELGLRVVSAEVPAGEEELFVEAGFTRDGVRRAWMPGALRDLAILSILVSEVRYSASPPEAENGGILRPE